jgi:AMP-binding enzyme
MLIHDTFRTDLIIHSNEPHISKWETHDWENLQKLKRYLKQQLINKLGNIRGQQFMIDRPIVLHKQIPLIMAIWDLGGAIVVNDLHYSLQQNIIYKDFFASINGCFIEYGDCEFNNLDQVLSVFEGRLCELKYFDIDQNITEDPIYAQSSDVALVVATSGTTRAPKQVAYTHEQVLKSMQANQEIYQYNDAEHVLHVKSFHHGGLCTSYFLPTLVHSQHHYFMPINDTMDNHVLSLLKEFPITRLMLPYAISDQLIAGLEQACCPVTLQTTHAVKSVEQVDQLFATNRVDRFMVLFGCSELTSIIFLHNITPTNWDDQRSTWDPVTFDPSPVDFWDIKICEDGLGVRSSWMDDYYVPGDQFKQTLDGRWQWQGRNTQIKREGIIVNPQTVKTVLNSAFPELDIEVVADYQHKRLYGFVFGVQLDDLLSKFNNKIVEIIDQHHMLDLVMCMSIKDMFGLQRSSENVLRFNARQQLGLEVD